VDGIRAAVVTYIVDELAPQRHADELTDATNLIEEEIIDSLGIFSVVGFIEERFGVAIDPEDVTIENFETIDAIASLIATRLGLGTAP